MSALDDAVKTALAYSSARSVAWHAEVVTELARLRRMADAYARWAKPLSGALWCQCCGGGNNHDLHTATCDVAAHLGLPREMEGE